MCKSKDDEKSQEKVVSMRILIYAIVIGVVCVFFIFALNVWIKWNEHLEIALSTILSTIFCTALMSIFWELLAKRSFLKEILKKTNIAANINEQGIDEIEVDFSEVDLAKIISDSSFAKIVVLEGSKVFGDKKNRKQFEKLKQMDVVLSENAQETIQNLANRFQEYDSESNYTIEKIKARLNESYGCLDEFKKNNNINIYQNNKMIYCAYYLFDKKAIFTTFTHQKMQKDGPVCVVCNKGGKLYDYISKEIDAIINCSEKRS